MTGPPTALVLRALGLGDLLATVPALRTLRAVVPDHRIVLACPEAVGELVRVAGLVDEVLPSGELEPVAWTGPPPDLGIDLHGRGPPSHVLVQALTPRRLVVFGTPDLPGPVWRPDEHESYRWCRLLVEGLVEGRGARCNPDDRRLPSPPEEPPTADAVVVHAGAASGARRWPAERFAQVAAALSGEYRVVLTGSAAEREVALQVAASAGLDETAVLAGKTTLPALAALVAAARLVVCGDTGVAHLASAYGRPSVLLFGPTPPAWWGPPPGPHTVLWHGCTTGGVLAGDAAVGGRRVGDPHAAEPDPALLAITVGEVLAAVHERLSTAGA